MIQLTLIIFKKKVNVKRRRVQELNVEWNEIIIDMKLIRYDGSLNLN